LTCP